MPKPRHKTTNWKHDNKALINRGSLNFWIDEEARFLTAIESTARFMAKVNGRLRNMALKGSVGVGVSCISTRYKHPLNIAVACQNLYGSNKK